MLREYAHIRVTVRVIKKLIKKNYAQIRANYGYNILTVVNNF